MSLELKDQYDKIYKYCYFKVKNSQLAEDLTQEAFLKFFSQNSYISHGKPLAYLYTIAKNLCIDTYKQRDMLSLDEQIPCKNTMEDFETCLTIKEAISTLPQNLQEILYLRYVNDLSMSEISNITGFSRFSVYRKIKKAIKKLKLILREEDFF